jgi:signal transduction histidine kinase
VSAVDARRLIVALGGLYIVLGALRAIRITAAGSSSTEVVSALLLVGVPGLVILYGGHRLPNTDLHPETYPRIVAWILGGFGLLLAIIGLRVLSPGVAIDNVFWSTVLATALGSVAGLAIGTHEARAVSRARDAEQRSQELAHTKAELQETVERLRTSNERLEQFAYAASHDLQEPLRMVSSYLQLLEHRYRDDLDADAREFIDFAVDGADRMRAMVEGLLKYSRATTNEQSMEETDADAVLEDTLTDLQLKIEETDATITTEELPTVTADPDQLAQVFQNLLSNALEYSGDNPPQVYVSAERTDDAWRFAVADEGIGIEPAYQERIFNVFEQLHQDDDAAETGAGGIGLALSQRIIERHGGEMWVDSEPGAGATFYFTIPTTEERSTAAPSHLAA